MVQNFASTIITHMLLLCHCLVHLRPIRQIAAAIRDGQIEDFDKIFDLKAYEDPFYVCNCIRMLEMLANAL